MVYCGGLENRFGFTVDGGSNPSLSAKLAGQSEIFFVSQHLTTILIWVAVVGVVFSLLWWKGYLVRLSNYVQLTKEELRKCTWPTWDELKGSTLLVAVSIVALGVFTMVVDYVFVNVVHFISKI